VDAIPGVDCDGRDEDDVNAATAVISAAEATPDVDCNGRDKDEFEDIDRDEADAGAVDPVGSANIVVLGIEKASMSATPTPTPTPFPAPVRATAPVVGCRTVEYDATMSTAAMPSPGSLSNAATAAASLVRTSVTREERSYDE
jgi:hypothetical protein